MISRLIDTVALIATRFALGLVCAFGGAALGYLLSMRGANLVARQIGSFTTVLTNEHYIDQLEKDGVDSKFHGDLQPKIDAALAAQPDLDKQMRMVQTLAIVPLIVFVASATFFVWALWTPLIDGGALIRSCTAAG